MARTGLSRGPVRTMFKRILIANRGEIACRIIRTARRLGIATVAVYSDADKDALHVDDGRRGGADRAGAGRRKLSLDREDRRRPASDAGAEAVHPGYGFLSERAEFARALDKAGIVFIGPNAKAIAAMGDKIAAKTLAAKAKVATVPGHLGVIEDERQAQKIARRDRLSGHDQGRGRRRRQGHAHRARRGRARGRLCCARARRRNARSATSACSSRNSSRTRATSKSRCSATSTAMSSISASANARSSAATRRSWRRRRRRSSMRRPASAMGAQAVALAQGGRLRFRRHGRVRRRPGQALLFPGNEHAAAGRASGDRTRHRHRSGRADDPRRGRREAQAQAERREARRLGGRDPHLCRGPVPQFPALDRPAHALSAAGGGSAGRRSRCATTPASRRAARSRSTTIR